MESIEPPPALSRPCKKCSHPKLNGWISYLDKDGFIYQYICPECDESHFFSCADIYGQSKEEKTDETINVIKFKALPVCRIIEKYELNFIEICKAFNKEMEKEKNKKDTS